MPLLAIVALSSQCLKEILEQFFGATNWKALVRRRNMIPYQIFFRSELIPQIATDF